MAHAGLFPLDLETPRAAVVRARVWESRGPGRARARVFPQGLQPREGGEHRAVVCGRGGPRISCAHLGTWLGWNP